MKTKKFVCEGYHIRACLKCPARIGELTNIVFLPADCPRRTAVKKRLPAKELTLSCLNCGHYIPAEEDAKRPKKEQRWCKQEQYIPKFSFCEKFVPIER